MAGAFGFEKGEHYEVSVRCGEQVLLPAVRHAENDSLIITNGFSCHEQIKQLANRHALHLAEVLRLAMTEGHKPKQQRSQPTDTELHGDGEPQAERAGKLVFAGAAVGLASAAGAWLFRRHKKHA